MGNRNFPTNRRFAAEVVEIAAASPLLSRVLCLSLPLPGVVAVVVVEAVAAVASRIRNQCDSSRAVIEFLPIG